MVRHCIYLVILILFLVLNPASACEKEIKCEKCGKPSEYTWNPSNKYVTSRLSRFYKLKDLATAAYNSNNFDKAKNLVNEYLELADIYRCNWNYGNAIHDGNVILGQISLTNGDVDEAASYLLKASESPGSPQLNSFGPDLIFANELLLKGRNEEVKIYLQNIKSFWEMDDGLIDNWIESIENGETPELNRFANVEVTKGEILVYWGRFIWPLILAFLFTFLFRKKIKKKWTFLISSIISGYIVMIITISLYGFILIQILANLDYSKGIPTWIYIMDTIPFVIPLIWNVILSKFFTTK